MKTVKRVDTLTNEVIEVIELYDDEHPILEGDELYILTQEEYEKYKNGTLETFEYGGGYDTMNAPYYLEAYEKFEF